ncbi:hypothetical protein DEU42_103132 [Flavobacterium sp. AG291]|nr:hypothetical protein DEU42_103132 [Flavobacterium sp. AG291]
MDGAFFVKEILRYFVNTNQLKNAKTTNNFSISYSTISFRTG